MAPFGAASLANLAGVKPITAYRAGQMAAYVTAHGGDIGIPADGGKRTLARQAQLVQYEQDSVAAGDPAYAVHSASATAPHVTGDAFDVRVNTPMNGLTVDQTYLAMAQYAPTLGLIAGYFFKSVPSDPFHFENKNRNDYAAPDGSAVDAGGAPAAPDAPTNPDGTLTYNGQPYGDADANNPYNANPTNPDGSPTYDGLPYDPTDGANPYTLAGGLPPVVVTEQASGLSVPALLAIAGLAFVGWKLLTGPERQRMFT